LILCSRFLNRREVESSSARSNVSSLVNLTRTRVVSGVGFVAVVVSSSTVVSGCVVDCGAVFKE